MAKWNFLCYLVVLAAAFVFFALDEKVDARRHSPLIGDENSHGRNRAAECTFGKQVKEIGSSWFADLGPPFGVMYCIKCDCVKIQKKRRVVAKVQCRNIKNECPKPTCDNPVLLPGNCCKSCPGDPYPYNPTVSDYPVPEESMKHYASLLTGRSSLVVKRADQLTVPVSINKNNVIATGRFTFHHRNLYYSFYVSDKAARPRFLQFVDDMGDILDEHTLSGPGIVTSLYQNVTRKICGVWRRLPKEYRRLLKDQKLYAVLVWGLKDQPEFTLSGQITRYVALGTELFSSLLEPAPGADSNLMAGAGGTAIVSTSSASTPSIHIAIVFNGIFTTDEVSEVPVNITLSLEEKQQIIIEEVKKVSKPAHELNIIEVSSPVSAAELRLLTRGRLVLSISSVSKPDALRLSGAVITRATCELFQTTLTSSNAEKDQTLGHPSGLSWMFMNSEGALDYHIQVDVKDPVSLITLVDVSAKRKTELVDLTAYYKDGWANGTLDRLGPRFLEPLYSGNLAVNIALENQSTGFIRGRLTARPVAEARDSPAPILLKRISNSLPSSVVGMGWLSIDNDCNIHYDLTLTGMGSHDKMMQLYLLEMPMMAPGAPVTIRHLEDFKGNQVEDSGIEIQELTLDDFMHLDSGVAYLEVKDKDSKNVLLKGTVKNVKVPARCLPHFPPDNTVPTVTGGRDTAATGLPPHPPLPPQPRSCYYEGQFYEENSDWITSDPCTMCFCQNGRVKCDVASCPSHGCSAKIKPSARECCPPCTNGTEVQEVNPRGCYFGKYFHSAGSRWHPFLIPNGFEHCTECFCDPDTLEVKCSRQECILNCDEKVAYKADERSCCKQCPSNIQSDPTASPVSQGAILTTKKPDMNVDGILSAGGCKSGLQIVENGTVYHPRLASLGEYKCVTCKCKNGTVTCERLKCSRSMCNNSTYRQRRNSIESTSVDKCCSCKRQRRHQHQHHRSHGQS